MSEERPVPRRESPWGLPEGDKRQPKAHRCNDRAEDVVQSSEVLSSNGSSLILLQTGIAMFSDCLAVIQHKPRILCYRVELKACFEGNPFKTVPGPFKLFWQCMRSNPGEEPTEPYTYLQLDPPKRAEAKLE